MAPALAVFVKTPGLSAIKTRLARGIGQAAAVRFQQLAAGATAEVVAACGDAVVPYWAVAEDGPLARANWAGFPRIAQGTGALGERLYRVHALLQARYGSVLMIGSDIPQITPGLIHDAVDTLSSPRVDHVMGPASDGGFWLFGSNRTIDRDTWGEVPYSTADTARVLRHNLAHDGRLALLATLTDVDTAENLPELREALSGLPDPTSTQRRLLAWVETYSPP